MKVCANDQTVLEAHKAQRRATSPKGAEQKAR
jgi:hypothetical protein